MSTQTSFAPASAMPIAMPPQMLGLVPVMRATLCCSCIRGLALAPSPSGKGCAHTVAPKGPQGLVKAPHPNPLPAGEGTDYGRKVAKHLFELNRYVSTQAVSVGLRPSSAMAPARH